MYRHQHKATRNIKEQKDITLPKEQDNLPVIDSKWRNTNFLKQTHYKYFKETHEPKKT